MRTAAGTAARCSSNSPLLLRRASELYGTNTDEIKQTVERYTVAEVTLLRDFGDRNR